MISAHRLRLSELAADASSVHEEGTYLSVHHGVRDALLLKMLRAFCGSAARAKESVQQGNAGVVKAHIVTAHTLQLPETTQRAVLRGTRTWAPVACGYVRGCCVHGACAGRMLGGEWRRGTSAAAGGRVKAKGGEVGVVRTGHRTAYGALVGIAPS